MEVILLERVQNLGQMGDVVKVRTGYARNFLLPKGKALRATQDNKAHFEKEKSQIEASGVGFSSILACEHGTINVPRVPSA